MNFCFHLKERIRHIHVFLILVQLWMQMITTWWKPVRYFNNISCFQVKTFSLLSRCFSADAGSRLRYFSPCWDAETNDEKKKRGIGSRQCRGTWGILERTAGGGGHNAVRRRAQGKLNHRLNRQSALCRIWSGVRPLCSTMSASSNKVRGDGLGLARDPWWDQGWNFSWSTGIKF